MADKRALEWTNSTTQQRKSLYRVVQAIRAATGKSMDDIFAEAHGRSIARSVHEDDNFRSGKIGHSRIAPIHRWVIENHLDLAADLAPDIFDPSVLTNWRSFLNKHGLYDDLIVKPAGRFGLTERSARQPIADMRIRLGEDFYFELTSDRSGALLALEGYGGNWHPFSLHANGTSLITPCVRGLQALPFDPNTRRPDPLRDTEHRGLHLYALLVADEAILTVCAKDLALGHPIKPADLDRIALALMEAAHDQFAVHRLNVIFMQ